jgi:hypothetical protein
MSFTGEESREFNLLFYDFLLNLLSVAAYKWWLKEHA